MVTPSTHDSVNTQQNMTHNNKITFVAPNSQCSCALHEAYAKFGFSNVRLSLLHVLVLNTSMFQKLKHMQRFLPTCAPAVRRGR